MEQAILEKKGEGTPKPPSTLPRLPLEAPPTLQNTRREVFALDEGDVVLTFPNNLSPASYDDLEAYLGVFLKKAKRLAKVLDRSLDDVKRPDDAENSG